MKKALYLFAFLAVFLSGCGTLEISFDTTPVSAAVPARLDPATPEAPAVLSLDSTSEEIQSAMLESATKWTTLWVDGTVT
jgi:hypothetical protein